MSGISLGAVLAATIAGIISIFGLIIGKEQKVSEFRQQWINDLRACIIDYITEINAISDIIKVRKAGEHYDQANLLACYQRLNKASHGIYLRLNHDEIPSQKLINSMQNFEKLAERDADLTPEKIRLVEEVFSRDARSLLKFEWSRVKRGEGIFVFTKRFILVVVLLFIILAGAFWVFGDHIHAVDTFKIFPA